MTEIPGQDRFAEFLSPLQNRLTFRRLSGQEAVGELGVLRVELLSSSAKIDHKKLLGQYCSVKFATSSGAPRYLGGVVSRFICQGRSEGRETDGLYAYVAELRPWLWLLTRRINCRIFENRSVVEVIEAVLKEFSWAHREQRLSESYATQEYCVQYRESDADFLIRLMEGAGIYYFFQHAADHQTLVLADSLSAHTPTSGYDSVPFLEAVNDASRADEVLTNWGTGWDVVSSACALVDYNFQTPAANLASHTRRTDQPWASQLEILDYPGLYGDASAGEAQSKRQLESSQAEHQRYEGHGTARGLAPGSLLKVTGNPLDDDSQQYLLLRVDHEISTNSIRAGDEGEWLYQCRVTAMPSEVPFRLPPRHPTARIEGPQTAVVVADQENAEIWTDRFGRIKVAFFWDRRDPAAQRVSCWLRVSQSWAGKNWGQWQLPRVGQEVIVSFLEGNPDRPIVTGCVYNAGQMPPDELPSKQTRAVFRTRSTPHGTADNFHELTFEDQKDAEQIYLHSERDFLREVENNDVLKVGFDKQTPGNQSISVFNNRTVTVGDQKAADGSQAVTVFNNDSLTVGNEQAADGSQTVEIWNHRTVTIKHGDDSLNVNQGDRKVTLGQGSERTTIDQGDRETTLKQGHDKLTLQTGNRSVSLTQGNYALSLDSGNVSIHASGGAIKLEAIQGIELSCGGSSVKISPSGIQIKGVQIELKADASLELQGGAMLQAKSSGIACLKGALVQIN
jgi:type VI secretion system secreted protein VgrG